MRLVPISADKRHLVAQLRSSETAHREAAWRSLYSQHYHQIYRLAARYGVEPSEVEDVAQRAFIIAFRRIHEVDDIRDPLAWLRGITVRVAAQQRRWRRVRQVKGWLVRESPVVRSEPVLTPLNSLAAAEDITEVRRVLDQLSPKLRTVLVLCDIEELKPGEAAEVLDLSVNTVRSRRRLAKEKFRQLWSQAR